MLICVPFLGLHWFLGYAQCTLILELYKFLGLRDRDLGPFRVLGQHRTIDNTGLCVNTRFWDNAGLWDITG